jgi:hypothetical protein
MDYPAGIFQEALIGAAESPLLWTFQATYGFLLDPRCLRSVVLGLEINGSDLFNLHVADDFFQSADLLT